MYINKILPAAQCLGGLQHCKGLLMWNGRFQDDKSNEDSKKYA